MKEKALYIRLSATKHRQLSQLVAYWETSLSSVVEKLVDQVLFQCVADFEAPDWLLRAIDEGILPIRRFGEDDGEPEEPVDNVVNFSGRG